MSMATVQQVVMEERTAKEVDHEAQLAKQSQEESHVKQKQNREDVSTEDASTEDSEADDILRAQKEVEDDVDGEQEAQNALLLYSQRMRESRELESEVCGGGFARKAFPWHASAAQVRSGAATGQLRAELEKQLGLKAGSLAPEGAAEHDSQERRADPVDGFPRTLEELRIRYAGQYSGAEIREYWFKWCRPLDELEAEAHGQEWELRPTFGYAGGLDKRPTFARYDVRDEVCQYVGGFRHGQVVRDPLAREYTVVGVKPDPQTGELRLWFQPNDIRRPAAGAFPHSSAAMLRGKLARVPAKGERLREVKEDHFGAVEDSDLEDILLCRNCRLPVGEVAYVSAQEEPVHGECMAQIVLQELKQEEDAHRVKESQVKMEFREQYAIGWRAESVPRNLGCLGRLGVRDVKGLCAIALDEATNTIRLVPTSDPAAAVNLEYLSIALKVRVLDGREPMFSLDAVDASKSDSMQRKVFHPEWLAGTSVGEVMFQADYHLKELSMGEYDQPVVGMKCCLDISEQAKTMEWNAREWFVVRKAEIHIDEEGVLSPFLKMGVEAREQVLQGTGLVDAPLTRHDHPLVQYAEAFTKNFDLIAERKSVIYHLRELAKASVLAKFLVDSDAQLDSEWYNLVDFPSDCGIMEIPQLWNERYRSTIQVKDGEIMAAPQDGFTTAHNVYGGIDFGLDRFSVAAPRAAISRVSARVPQRTALLPGAPSGAFAAPARSMLAAAPALSSISRVAGGVRAVTGPASVLSAAQPRMGFAASRMTAPQGVDLNLDRFELSTVMRVSAEAEAGGWGRANLEKISGAFWANLDGESNSVFSDEDRNLLRQVFNPKLSDRREDGERFVPPDTGMSYVAKLRDLVKEEATVRERRQSHFLGKSFAVGDAGALFPPSWTSSMEIANAEKSVKNFSGSPGTLYPRPEFVAAAGALREVLSTATPAFDMSTEDAIRYRIYKFGNLEVRTVAASGGEETVGAVFSVHEGAPQHTAFHGGVHEGSRVAKGVEEHAKVVKVTEYVERSSNAAGKSGCAAGLCRRSYVALEAEGGTVVTELLADGTVTWQENPADLPDRNSLAKVVRSMECADAGVTVGDIKRFQIGESQRARGSRAAASQRKAYAHAAYSRTHGEEEQVYSGFRQAAQAKWQLFVTGEACADRPGKGRGKGRGKGKARAPRSQAEA